MGLCVLYLYVMKTYSILVQWMSCLLNFVHSRRLNLRMVLPTQPDHLLSGWGNGKGSELPGCVLPWGEPRLTGLAKPSEPPMSQSPSISQSLFVPHLPLRLPVAPHPPAPLSPPPPGVTPGCIWLQILGGDTAATPTTGWLLCHSVIPSQLCGHCSHASQGQACLPFALGLQTTAQSHQGPISSGLRAPSLFQASEASSLLVSPANWETLLKCFIWCAQGKHLNASSLPKTKSQHLPLKIKTQWSKTYGMQQKQF